MMKLVKQTYVNQGLPKGWKPYYIYLIEVATKIVGKIVLREGTNEERYYDGHIGYTIEPEYRGHHYAYQAVMLIKPIAKELGFNELIITCSPDNIASKKTIKKLHAQYLETKAIPKQYYKDFKDDERIKEIYLLKL